LELRQASQLEGKKTLSHFNQIWQQKAIRQTLLRTDPTFTRIYGSSLRKLTNYFFPTHLGTYQSPGLPGRPGRDRRPTSSPPANTRRSRDRGCPGGIWKRASEGIRRATSREHRRQDGVVG